MPSQASTETDDSMNVTHVEFELAEALSHLQSLVTEFRAHRVQSDDTPELAVQLGHILDHICFAWNGRDLTQEELQALPQAEFERLTDTVPNFNATRSMGDAACC